MDARALRRKDAFQGERPWGDTVSKGREINWHPVSSGERERIRPLKKNKDEASFLSKVFISFSPGFILFLDDGKTSKLRLKSLPSSLLEKKTLLDKMFSSWLQYVQWSNGNAELDRLRRFCISYEYVEAKQFRDNAVQGVDEIKAMITEINNDT
ncbi:hypothetical protein Tco_0562211 [Tanacetum coccineum]